MTLLGRRRRSRDAQRFRARCASQPRDERKTGGVYSYALRALDDTKNLKSSRRRRNPALNFYGVSRHTATPGNLILILRLVSTLIKLLLLGPLLLALLD